MNQQQQPSLAQKEAQVQLAKIAIERDQFQSNRQAAITFDVSEATLRNRRARIPSRHDYTPNSRLLTDLEEEVLKLYILKLHSRGHPPNL
jgi:hypothetical protein